LFAHHARVAVAEEKDKAAASDGAGADPGGSLDGWEFGFAQLLKQLDGLLEIRDGGVQNVLRRLHYNCHSVPILGIDIGGTRLKAGLVDDAGAISSLTSTRTPATLSEFREEMARVLCMPAASGAGIACKGIINSETTRVEVLPGTLHYLEGHLLSDFVTGVAVVRADNDARAALAGEMAWGAARGRRNAVMLTLGTGVGGGILAAGGMLRGSRGVAGHLGHLTVDPDGPVCICGNRGCLETIFSARAIEAEAIAAVLRGCDSSLTGAFGNDPRAIMCEAV